MTTRLSPYEQQLTGFACKAAGRTPHDIDESGAWFEVAADSIVGAWQHFNPLRSNGDAFALITRLRLMTYISDDRREARVDSPTGHHYTAFIDGDADAAMRKAIVYCAAYLGGYSP